MHEQVGLIATQPFSLLSICTFFFFSVCMLTCLCLCTDASSMLFAFLIFVVCLLLVHCTALPQRMPVVVTLVFTVSGLTPPQTFPHAALKCNLH